MSDQHQPASPPANLRRRGFLLTLGVGSAATAATVLEVIPAVSASAQQEAEPAAGEGYRATQHVRDYYRTTKI